MLVVSLHIGWQTHVRSFRPLELELTICMLGFQGLVCMAVLCSCVPRTRKLPILCSIDFPCSRYSGIPPAWDSMLAAKGGVYGPGMFSPCW